MTYGMRRFGLQSLVALGVLALTLLTGTTAHAYQFFRANLGGCRWVSLGPGNVDFLVDTSSTAAIGSSLLTEMTTARDRWNNIATARNVFGNFTASSVDFTHTNIGTAWGANFNTSTFDLTGPGPNEVVLDETGEIISLLGANPLQLLGLGLSRRVVSGATCSITRGLMLVNGTTALSRLGIVVHEFGHILGLAHSSVGEFNSRNNAAFSGGSASPSPALDPIAIGQVPAMHPFASSDVDLTTPKTDDIAGLSELYPEAIAATTFGAISGTVKRCEDNSDLLGVNVRAVNVANPNIQVTRYTGFDGSGTGFYRIGGLPAGNYRVIVESMGANGFDTGRMAIETRLDQGFETEYYGPTQNAETNCTEALPDTALQVSVAAAATSANTNIKVGGVELAFVVDDTGSMSEEIASVRNILNKTVTELAASDKPFPMTAIITFKDDVTFRIRSDKPAELKTIIDSLFASGGAACPEASNAALLAAARVLRNGGKAILFTDADSHSAGPTRAEVESAYTARGLRLSVLLDGSCSEAFPFSDARVAKAALQGAPSPSKASDTFPEPETLGPVGAIANFSDLAVATGGIFHATGQPLGGTDTAQAYENVGVNISVSSVLPAVGVANPGSGPRGATMTVQLVGQNTNWNSTSVVTFSGSTIVVNGVTVDSATILRASITIPAGAATGFVDVQVVTDLTGGATETAKGVGAFQVTNATGFPTLTSVTPSTGGQGATNLSVAIQGVNTTFGATTTVAFQRFGSADAKITVHSVAVSTGTSLVAVITIAADADVGFRDVQVATGGEVVTGGSMFLVTSPPTAIPRIVGVNPNQGARSVTNMDIQITGENTHFVNGVSVTTFNQSGITVVSTTVTSATQATVRVNIAPDATLGFRDVTIATNGETAAILNGFQVVNQPSLVASVLPGSRSVQVGNPATAFVTIINAGTTTATAVQITLASAIPATLNYQTTDPTTNAVTGTPNTPVNIAPGAGQSFVIGVTPTGTFSATNVQFVFGGTNSAPVATIVGVNTLLLSASAAAVPDIIALAATIGNDGIVNIPGATGTGVFAVATFNVGVVGTITASADTGGAALPVTLLLCETFPATGACKAAPAPTVTRAIATSETPTYGVFVVGSGNVPFSPGANRVFVRFRDASGEIRGTTSVAVRTQ